jgi:HopA1 effector protein family
MFTRLLDPCQPVPSDALLDMVNHLQIRSNLYFCHSHYQPLEIPPGILPRFARLTPTLQQKYLSLQLRNYLHSIYFTGNCRLSTNQEEDTWSINRPLQNNTARGINLEFYQNLQASNSGKGFFDPDWQITGKESDNRWVVCKNGLTLHITPCDHLRSTKRSSNVGDFVAIRLPNNQLAAGYYVAVGNAGLVDFESVDRQIAPALAIYFNISSVGAIALMSAITAQLNEIALPFTLSTLVDPLDYERYDTAILSCTSPDYPTVQPLLQTIYRQHQEYFRSSIPIFTKFLAPGIGLATWSATDTCFGLDRCQLVADGLLAAEQQHQRSPDERLAAIYQQFTQAEIDWQQPYLSLNSIDSYSPLNL